ncbi:MAG: (2Fe-2S)-binding protein [Pseudonocardiaceae bacterium]
MHPLTGSITAVNHVVEWMSFHLVDQPGAAWTRCEQALSDPDFFDRWRASVAGWLGERRRNPAAPGNTAPDNTTTYTVNDNTARHTGGAVGDAPETDVPERTTAGYVLQWYLGVPTYLGAMLFHSARRVPALQPSRLAFRFEPGWVEAVALQPGRFWCLPDDPDAEHADAVVVPDDAALGAVLRREVVSHAAHFLRIYGPMVRFGRRTLWAAVTDGLDTGLLLAGRSFGSAQAGAADARLVLAERFEPLTAASTICQVTDDRGRIHWTRRRGSCCFSYAMPDMGPCATCPRTDDEERARILGTLDQP